MAVKRPRRKEPTAVRRENILQAAKFVFAQSGFADTNVEDIATRAGIAKGTLYLYFTSKEQIYMAALLEDARRLDTITRERMDAAPCWQSKIREYFTVRLDYLESHKEFLRIFLSEIRGKMIRGAPIGSEFLQVVRESESLITQVFAAAAARGDIRNVDPELAAVMVVDLSRGLLERRLMGWCREATCTDVNFVLDLLSHALSMRREADPDCQN